MNERSAGGAFPYFPPLRGEVSCERCELCGQCPSRGKPQRNRRELTAAAGRCPRLPDRRGFVDPAQQELYAAVFPLVHAKREGDKLTVQLQIPGVKRWKKVRRTRSGLWYIRDRRSGGTVKQALTVHGAGYKESILYIMETEHTDDCVFRCTIEDYFV